MWRFASALALVLLLAACGGGADVLAVPGNARDLAENLERPLLVSRAGRIHADNRG